MTISPKARFGESNPNALLAEEDVLEIRKLASRGVPRWAVAAQFRVSYDTVYSITVGRRWSYLDWEEA